MAGRKIPRSSRRKIELCPSGLSLDMAHFQSRRTFSAQLKSSNPNRTLRDPTMSRDGLDIKRQNLPP